MAMLLLSEAFKNSWVDRLKSKRHNSSQNDLSTKTFMYAFLLLN